MLMESGIAKMIQDAIIRMAILLKPGEITNRTIGVDPRIRHSWLRYDHIDVVMASEFRQQFDTVICDASCVAAAKAIRRQGAASYLPGTPDVAALCIGFSA